MGMIRQLLAEDSGATFMSELKWLIVVLMSIAGSLCILYAIYIGYLFATATDDGKRRAAKDRLIKVISSGLIIVALAFCLNVIDLKFDTPNNGESGGSADDPLSGHTELGKACLYNNFTTKEIEIQEGKTVTITISCNYITSGGKSIDFGKFEGFKSFTFNEKNIKNTLDEQDAFKPSDDGKSLTYTLTPPMREDGDKSKKTIAYAELEGKGGKYLLCYVGFSYDGKMLTAQCFIKFNIGAGYEYGNKSKYVV